MLGLIVVAALAVALAVGFFAAEKAAAHANEGFVFDESSTVSGSGEVSIKGEFHDKAVNSKGWMKGSGSISLESLRNMNKSGPEVGLTQKSDLVFTGGQLKNKNRLELPLFENGNGATVSERFNLSHVDRSQESIIKSTNIYNNKLNFNTSLAFEGMWDIKNTRGWSINMNRSEERYTGSFQTQKKIVFNDSAYRVLKKAS